MISAIRSAAQRSLFRLGAAALLLATPGAFGIVTATPSVPILSFPATAVGTTATTNLTVTFTITGYNSYPTITYHYGTDYSTYAETCDGLTPETCTLTVKFKPTVPGARRDAIFVSYNGARIATVLLSGIGTGPLGAFQNGVFSNTTNIATLGAGHYSAPAIDENHNLYFFYNNNLYKSGSLGTPSLLLSNATSGDQFDLAIDGAGVLYWGIGSQAGPHTTINTYDTVQNTSGTLTMPASDLYYAVATDASGDVFGIGANSGAVYKVPLSGSPTTTTLNPAITQPYHAATDAAGDIFVGAGTINELTAGGTQSQVSTIAASEGLSTDAAATLYVTTPSGVTNELAASNYAAASYTYSSLNATVSYGNVLGSDGTIYFATAGTVDVIDRTQNPLTFNSETANTAYTQTVNVANIGNQTLNYSAITITGAGFTLSTASQAPCTPGIALAPGANCNVSVTFQGAHAGSYSGSVVLTSNSLNNAASTQTIAMTGYIRGPYVTAAPNPLVLPNQTIGTTSSIVYVTITNTGYDNTTGLTLSSSNPAFTITNSNANSVCTTTSTLQSAGQPYNFCLLAVTFSPTLAQNYSGTITVTGNGGIYPNSVVTIPVSGNGTPVVSQTAGGTGNVLIFNNAPVATATPQTITASFLITGETTLINPTASMNYGTSYTAGKATCVGSIGAQTCSVPVTFKPTLPGGRKDALFLTAGGVRVATALVYGVGTAPFALIQPGVFTQPILNGALAYYYGAIVDENGTAYVLATGNNAVVAITSAGVVTTLPISNLNSPREIAIDGAGILYIADQTAKGVITTYDTVQGVQGSVPFQSTEFYNQGVATGNTGNLYLTDSNNIYTIPLSGPGTAKTTAVNPANTQNGDLIVDSSEDVFNAGYAINELTPAGVQTQVNTTAGNSGFGVDAAGTLYSGRYGNGGIGELPASNYSTQIAYVDGIKPVLGLGVGPDGTVYAGDYANVDKVDRSQGLFTFDSVNPNQVGTPQVATIYNGGNMPLTVTSTTLTGDPNYTVTANNCVGTVIPVAGVCTFTVNFTAPHNGIFTGAVTIVTNSLNATTTQTLALTDTVSGGYLTASPTTLNFGTVPLNTPSAPMYVTITNTGANAADIQQAYAVNTRYQFTIPPACNNIPVGGSCQLSVIFTPNVSGPINSTGGVTVATSLPAGNRQPNAPQVTLTGTGGAAAAPIATLSATSLTFTGNPTTTSPVQVVQLSNTGNAPLILTTTYLNGSSFFAIIPTLTTNPCAYNATLAAGASCNIAVNFSTFQPTSAGPYTASITIVDNDATGQLTIALSGTVVFTRQLQFTPTQVTAIAGTGALTSSGTGDNGPALSATFAQPFAVAQDPAGNTYVVDYGANYVRKIAPNGTITQFAGQVGYINHGFSGDGGPAINAQLNQPDGIAIDQAGNVYIADELNGRVRVVNAATGIISTYAGSGVGAYVNGASASAAKFPGPVGLTFDPSGNLYVAMGQNSSLVVEVTPAGTTSTFAGGNGNGYNGDNILATAAQLSTPYSVASDQSGNIYIADNGNSRVRKVTASTGKITTVAGNGTVSSTGDGGAASSATVIPYNVAVNLAGDVFIEGGTSSNLTSFSVRKITANGAGSISTVAGGGSGGLGGPATSANFNQLEGIGIDNNGSLLITTYGPGTSQLVSAGPAGFLQFPSTVVAATSAAQVITLENTGDANLTLPNATYTATGPFAVTGGSCLQANTVLGTGAFGGCNITVTFTPTAATTQTGTITVASNGSIASQTINLQGTGTPGSAPAVTITPSSLTFTAAVNATSPTQNVTITNTGTATLTGPSASILGASGFYFNIQSTSCTGSLAPTASCVVAVNFSPSNTTPVTATLSFADNAAGSPQTVSLTGTGSPAATPIASLSPTGLTFTATTSTVAYNQAIALSNTGTATLNISSVTLTGTNSTAFALLTAPSSPCGATLAAGATCNLYVSLTANTVGTYSANVVVTDNASPTTQTATLSGTVTGVGAATFSPTSLNFPSTTTNTSATAQTLVLTNNGTATITGIGAVTISGTGASAFAQTNNCTATLAPGASCSVSVTFTPGSATLFAATVNLTDSVGTQSASVGGTGVAPTPQAALTAALAFPSTVINTTATALTATLTNAGTAALPITSAVASSQFALSANTCGSSLAAGASCTYSITFTPTATGAQTGTLTVVDSVGTQTTALTGTGSPVPVAQAVLSPTSFTFASTFQGTPSSAQVFTLSNPGSATLSGIAISFTGANPTFFAQTTTCGTTLAAAAACNISVVFTPAVAATYTANLSVATSVATVTAALTGSGNSSTGFTVVAPAPIQTVDPGQAAIFNINVNTLTGNYTLPVTLSASGLPPGATYSFAPATVVPGITGAPTVLTIQTAAAIAGLRPAELKPLRGLPILAAFLLLPFAGMRRLRRKVSPALRLLSLILISLAALLPLSGCGGGGYFGQAPHSYAITVTGTSSAATQSTTVTLNLQ